MYISLYATQIYVGGRIFQYIGSFTSFHSRDGISPNFIKLGFPPFLEDRKSGSFAAQHIFAARNIRFLEKEVHKTALHLSRNEQTEREEHRVRDKRAEPSIGQSYVCMYVYTYIHIYYIYVYMYRKVVTSGGGRF